MLAHSLTRLSSTISGLLALPLLGNTWMHDGFTVYLDNQVRFVDGVVKVANSTGVVMQSLGYSMADTLAQVNSAQSKVKDTKVLAHDFFAYTKDCPHSRWQHACLVLCGVYVVCVPPCAEYALRL
jgi:hypothetical protein